MFKFGTTVTPSVTLPNLLVWIKDFFLSEAANPNMLWEVAEWVGTTPQTLIIKRKNGNPGRIGFVFDGSTLSTANANGWGQAYSSYTSYGYMAYSSAGTENTRSNNPTTGKLLASADFPMHSNGQFSTTQAYNFEFWNDADRVLIAFGNGTYPAIQCYGKWLYSDETDLEYECVLSCATQYPPWSGQGDTGLVNGYGNWLYQAMINASPNNGFGAVKVGVDTWQIHRIYPSHQTYAPNSIFGGAQRIGFLPFMFQVSTAHSNYTGPIFFRTRKLLAGHQAFINTSVNTAAGLYARNVGAINPSTTTNSPGLWIPETAV